MFSRQHVALQSSPGRLGIKLSTMPLTIVDVRATKKLRAEAEAAADAEEQELEI